MADAEAEAAGWSGQAAEVCGSKELEMTETWELIKSFLEGNWKGCRRRSVTASDGSLDAPAAMRLRKLRGSKDCLSARSQSPHLPAPLYGFRGPLAAILSFS